MLDLVMTSRQEQFEAIKIALQQSLRFSGDRALVAEGDSLVMLRSMPTHSVSLILTDPPYHSTKKQNIHGDTAFAKDEHYLPRGDLSGPVRARHRQWAQ